MLLHADQCYRPFVLTSAACPNVVQHVAPFRRLRCLQADEAELPPDIVAKAPKIPAPQHPARPVSVNLNDLATPKATVDSAAVQPDAGAGAAGAAPGGVDLGGSMPRLPMPQAAIPWTLGQKLALLGATGFLIYASFTKLRPLWSGEKGGAAARAVFGPRINTEGAPMFNAAARSKATRRAPPMPVGSRAPGTSTFASAEAPAAAAEAASPEIRDAERRLQELRRRVADVRQRKPGAQQQVEEELLP